MHVNFVNGLVDTECTLSCLTSTTMNPLSFSSPAQTAAYLRTLPAIRERCSRVHALAAEGKLNHFDYHPDKEADAVAFCIQTIKARRARLSRPPCLSPLL